MKEFRKNIEKPIPTVFNKIPGVSLLEFFSYLAANQNKSLQFNEHWRPLSTGYCNFCNIPYNYVLKLEELDEEMSYVIEKLSRKKHQMIANPSDQYRDNEKLADLETIPPELIDKVAQIYRDDFEMFDYEMPNAKLKQISLR